MSTILLPYMTEPAFHFPDTLQVNDEFKWVASYDGEIVGYAGTLAVLGTGAGTSVDVQLVNDDTGVTYFSTQPTFEVNSATKVLEGGELIDSPTFRQGETLRAYITAISTAPKDGIFRIICKLRKPVTV